MPQDPRLLVKALQRAIPIGDTSIDHRVLQDVANRAKDEPLFALLELARTRTAQARRNATIVDEDETAAPAWRKRRRQSIDKALDERTKELVRLMRDSAGALRAELFGERYAPFSTLADAARWIEEQTPDRRPLPPSEITQMLEALYEAVDRLQEANPWEQFDLSTRDLYLEYWTANGWPGRRAASRTARAVNALRRWSVSVSDQTALPRRSLVAYLLTDLVPGQEVKLEDGRVERMPGLRPVELQYVPHKRSRLSDPPITRHEIVLRLDIRDVTDRQFRIARQRAAVFLSGKVRGSRHQTADQQVIVGIVDSLGGPPKVRFDATFWTRANRELPVKKRLQDPIALARRYYRAIGASSATDTSQQPDPEHGRGVTLAPSVANRKSRPRASRAQGR